MTPNVSLLGFLNDLYDREPPQSRFTATTEVEWRAWCETAKRRLRELLTMDTISHHAWREAPAPLVTERVEESDHVRERVLIPTLTGLWLPCFVLSPKTRPPHPAVLCLHGHGMSKHILIGRPRDEEEQKLLARVRGDYALRFVRAGFLTLAPDAAGYGERTEATSKDRGLGMCQHIFVNALSLGMSLQGIRVWEFRRALDYLVARPDVQAERGNRFQFQFGRRSRS